MITTQEYPGLLLRGKGIQRDMVVRAVFHSQTRLAQFCGVTPGYINHIIWLRRSCDQIDRLVAEQVKRLRPDLLDAWTAGEEFRRAA